MSKLVAVGQLSKGEDFAVLEAEITDCELPIIPLADAGPEMGETVSNIASPMSFGKTLFRGYVASTRISDDVCLVSNSQDDRKNLVLFNLVGAPGSSGSAIVSQSQKGIVAILLLAIKMSDVSGFSFLTAGLSVVKFKEFWNKAKAEIAARAAADKPAE